MSCRSASTRACPDFQLAPAEEPSPSSLDIGFSLTRSRPDVPTVADVRVSRRDGCSHRASTSYFLPEEAFRGPLSQPYLDKSHREDLTLLLRELREPTLSCSDRRSLDYRLVWLPAFDRRVIIRVTIPTDEAGPTVVLADARERHARALRPNERSQLVTLLVLADFWNLDGAFDEPYPDAPTWVLEAREGGAYHVVGRHLVPPGHLRDLGAFFFTLVNLPVPRG